MIKRITQRMARVQGNESGFTLVELLVVVAIVVALAAVSVVSVTQFASKGDEGATAVELETIQAALDTMMADKGVTAVTANDLGTSGSGSQDFTSVPTEGALVSYLRDNPTTYGYCWDSTGKAIQMTGASTTAACPAGPY